VGVLVASEDDIRVLVAQMSVQEKVGQLQQVNGADGHVSDRLRDEIRAGRVGAILNEVHVDTVNELQRLAVEDSPNGIPLLFGRDVIHGFKTIFPIPLGQAATWDPDLIERGARVAAVEAAASGINWTFAPMIDIGRDPRWGRVAEGLGEDPHLTSVLGAAMVRGFQGDNLAAPGAIAACAKHFAAYGASESGRDYNSTNVPENELRNVYLPPFRAAIEAGVASVMTSFSDLDGVPGTANPFLLQHVLRDEWSFGGLVVSDWESIRQLAVHGFTATDRDSAFEAAHAGVDMEMASTTYQQYLASLVADGQVSEAQLDAMVTHVLRIKWRLGLFDSPYTDPTSFPAPGNPRHLQVARQAATASAVLLRNVHGMLPLSAERLDRIAVIGPLADDPHEQLGTWVFDGDVHLSQPLLPALRTVAGDGVTVEFARGLLTTRSKDQSGFPEAIAAARRSDVVVLVLGEEAILSGEAHCRTDITLPGAQEALVEAIAATGKPVVLVLMAGRALALERVLPHVHALLYAFHPGTMGGPALADLLFGIASPSGKLPVTLPRVTGQIPIYYAHKNTGKPPTPETVVHMDDVPSRVPQLSVGNTSFHLDTHPTPLFPFGYGLSYSSVTYSDLRTSSGTLTRRTPRRKRRRHRHRAPGSPRGRAVVCSRPCGHRHAPGAGAEGVPTGPPSTRRTEDRFLHADGVRPCILRARTAPCSGTGRVLRLGWRRLYGRPASAVPPSCVSSAHTASSDSA
jgi:beta-glucosidase